MTSCSVSSINEELQSKLVRSKCEFCQLSLFLMPLHPFNCHFAKVRKLRIFFCAMKVDPSQYFTVKIIYRPKKIAWERKTVKATWYVNVTKTDTLSSETRYGKTLWRNITSSSRSLLVGVPAACQNKRCLSTILPQ